MGILSWKWFAPRWIATTPSETVEMRASRTGGYDTCGDTPEKPLLGKSFTTPRLLMRRKSFTTIGRRPARRFSCTHETTDSAATTTQSILISFG